MRGHGKHIHLDWMQKHGELEGINADRQSSEAMQQFYDEDGQKK